MKRQVVIGVGCDRGASLETLQGALDQALGIANLSLDAVAELATIDKKRDEQAILLLARRYGWPLRFFSAYALAQVEVPNPSETVRGYMGTPAVSEAAAVLAANARVSDLLLEKHKHKGADGKNATVSIVGRSHA